MNAKDIARVKGLGFLHNRGSETFSARVLSKNGTMTVDQLLNIAECARLYGAGRVAFTSRLMVEIPGIQLQDVEKVQAHVAAAGLTVGGTGPKVRPITACKGTTCVYGNADTQGIAAQLFDTFYTGWHDVTLPHKFKISVGGCPNSCMKPSLNDFGIEAHRIPRVQIDKCRGCAVCQVAAKCPMKAVCVENGKMVSDPALCNHCGVCIEACPFGAIPENSEPVFAVYVGGTWGKKTRSGTRLSRYYKLEELEPLLEKTLLWFRDNAFQKERLGAAIDRLGVEKLEQDLLGNDLLQRKEAILSAPLKQA